MRGPTEWRDAEGTDYELVLLATTRSDAFCIGGVALLAKSGSPRAGKLGPLAEAIGRALIVSGDALSATGDLTTAFLQSPDSAGSDGKEPAIRVRAAWRLFLLRG